MINSYKDYIMRMFGMREDVVDFVEKKADVLKTHFDTLDEICSINQLKILNAFQKARVNATHFGWNTGYGYDDAGREAVEKVYASVFNTESALVRTGMVNGTHAISTALYGILRPGDELIYCTGAPYDTLKTVIGVKEGHITDTASGRHFGKADFAEKTAENLIDTSSESHKKIELSVSDGNIDNIINRGTLIDYGIKFKEIPLRNDDIDLDALKDAINSNTKMVAMQRSTGYDWRPAISLESFKEACTLVHKINPDIITFADNCYGEFVSSYEPTDVGADIMAGSLIKNPGGGLALSGGYVAGKSNLVELASYRLTCPGIGDECGLTFGQNRSILQGLFIAPSVVNAAIKGAMLVGAVYDSLGFEVCPVAFAGRSDIVQAVKFCDHELMTAFCQSIQSASPIDSYVTPIPWDMPGYSDQVVMAAGNFVEGSSIEMSADGPMREPYIAYYQGGLTYEHAKFGVIKSLNTLAERELININNIKKS